MGEIHYPCYAENNRQAKRHESVKEAGHEPGDQDIEENGEITQKFVCYSHYS